MLLLTMAVALACSLVLATSAFAALKNAPDSGLGVDGRVSAILRVGDTIYVGGNFQKVGGAPRSNLAAIDADTGALRPWNPNANGWVTSLAISPDGTRVYAGGYFTKVGDVVRSRVAAINASTGSVYPAWDPVVDEPVQALATQGDDVYIGGSFREVDGQRRARLAAVSGVDGTLLPDWQPAVVGRVFDLKVEGARLYVGGSFKRLAGKPRRNLTALNTASGTLTTWNPNPARPVLDLVASGKRVYTAEGGRRGGAVGAYATGSGNRAWTVGADGDAQAISVMGGRVYAGGHFTSLSGKVRIRLAALRPGSGKLDARWTPRASGGVWALTPDTDRGNLYAGGEFTTISGKRHPHLAKFSRLR